MKWYYLSRNGKPVVWSDHPVQSPVRELVQAAKDSAFYGCDVESGEMKTNYDLLVIVEIEL